MGTERGVAAGPAGGELEFTAEVTVDCTEASISDIAPSSAFFTELSTTDCSSCAGEPLLLPVLALIGQLAGRSGRELGVPEL